MKPNSIATVMVYGAAGHTGRFVVEELRRRGAEPIVAGRSAQRLQVLAPLEQRVFGLDDAAKTAAALADVDVVINCAGPFLDTALPLATAAVNAGTHYLDVTAEQPVVQALYELDGPAREAGVSVVPAMAFYGGLADLMASSALAGNASPAEVTVAVGLDRWWPTAGTRITGERNTSVRQVIRDGRLVPMASPAPTSTWTFDGDLGEQPVVELTFSEVITMHSHLPIDRLTAYLNTGPLADLRDTSTPAPEATDDNGRSPQRFVVDVVARCEGVEHRVRTSGRDIYAVTAPIVVEGAVRLVEGRNREAGALAPGAAFEADDVLSALAAHPAGVTVARTSASTVGAPASVGTSR